MLQWGPPLGRERDGVGEVAEWGRSVASMGPATGAGKGRSDPATALGARRSLQWGPPLGRERDARTRWRVCQRSGASMGPATGAGKGHHDPHHTEPHDIRFNGARHWGGKGTNNASQPRSSGVPRFNGARHWGGKGTRRRWTMASPSIGLQWGPPLGRERDVGYEGGSVVNVLLQWGPPLGRERDRARGP